ncbi:MAG: YihY/virulence factor BrkB family protein [Desulfobacteraceae bacterium]|nr:MAG: YihY/virulence factor BrkB family protein [Desulfobacteraceae bacterium]
MIRIRELWKEINDDNVFNGAAALAYYLMLAIFPMAIFLLSLLPYLPIPDLEKAIMDLMHQVLPQNAADLFQGIVEDVTSEKRGGVLTFGILFTIWSAASGMYAIMQQLNITYDVKEERPFWKVRGTAILLLLIFAVLVIGAFTLVILGGVIQDQLSKLFGSSNVILFAFASLRWLIIAFFLSLGFACIYYFGPDVEQRFRFITPGSVTGVILLVVASLGFRFYIESFGNYSATYGSIGAVIILMLWLYIAGLVILIGSEINAMVEHHSPNSKSKGQKKEPR